MNEIRLEAAQMRNLMAVIYSIVYCFLTVKGVTTGTEAGRKLLLPIGTEQQ